MKATQDNAGHKTKPVECPCRIANECVCRTPSIEWHPHQLKIVGPTNSAIQKGNGMLNIVVLSSVVCIDDLGQNRFRKGCGGTHLGALKRCVVLLYG